MEHTSDLVYEGKLIHETSYPQRSEKYQEIEIEGIKIDYYEPKNKIIHEVKKSDKVEVAHEWQLKYYIYVLEKNGINDVTGILEYPALRKTDKIFLSERDRNEIEQIQKNIEGIINSEKCPQAIKQSLCRSCSYYDFCWCGEGENSEVVSYKNGQ
jgi:CRISPR-associated exonuclease Cas4